MSEMRIACPDPRALRSFVQVTTLRLLAREDARYPVRTLRRVEQVRVVLRCRSPKISIRSVTSVRAVSTNRSA